MARRPLYFTFGNHMHWVDMQWLWGYEVLPGSIRDMIHLVRETGTRGNINFDVIGYEKLAAEAPDALAELRAAVQAGEIEPVGCTWGEPYGLFQGTESNIRQITFGVRGTQRTLGVRPKTFWEEEFYFFPQLPQMLAGCGFINANLFFQWTWHTPELPKENTNLIFWEGTDGTRLATLPRNTLNVHQWPEDFEGLLDGELVSALNPPVIVQWLELMPSRDWMCRSEVLLPPLRAFLADERFEIVPGTCSDLIARLLGEYKDVTAVAGTRSADVPVRRYALDDVWHGMCLGRNADRHPRTSWRTERLILAAEAMSAISGIFGRPYASWDVYPTWELDEAWRELLAAQHHDNHECEALCGFVGYAQFAKARHLAAEVLGRTMQHLIEAAAKLSPSTLAGMIEEVVEDDLEDATAARRAGAAPNEEDDFVDDDDEDDELPPIALSDAPILVINPWGWVRDVPVDLENLEVPLVARNVPPFGFVMGPLNGSAFEVLEDCAVDHGRDEITLSAGGLSVSIDRDRGVITQIRSPEFPDGILAEGHPLLDLMMTVEGELTRFEWAETDTSSVDSEVVYIERQSPAGGNIDVQIALDRVRRAVRIDLTLNLLARPDAGMHHGLRMPIRPRFANPRLLVDAPGSIEEIRHTGTYVRKYPEGDWMTSPQWFEDIHHPFNALHLVDWVDCGARRDEAVDLFNRPGFLIVAEGAKQYFAEHDASGNIRGAEALIAMYDPWDERFDPEAFGEAPHYRMWIIPHAGISHADRMRHAFGALGHTPAAIEARSTRVVPGNADAPRDAPAIAEVLSNANTARRFGLLDIENAPNVLATSLSRESMKSGEHLPAWAGHRLFSESDGACAHPFVLRLVEYDGRPAPEVVIRFAGPCAAVARTTLLGEVHHDALPLTPADPVEPCARTGGRGAQTGWLPFRPADPPPWAEGLMLDGEPVSWCEVRLSMVPHEITTLMFDLIPGRKRFRDLDAKRKIWATIHRVPDKTTHEAR